VALFSVQDIGVSGMCAAVPKNSANNDELGILSELQRAKFVKTVGIKTRRLAHPDMCASDLCIAAAERLVKGAELTMEDIGALVFVTQTPDYPLPGNSMLAQRRLGLPTSTYLLDLHQGCAGFVYGLASLVCLMSTTGIEKGLLLAGDTITRLLDSTDTSTVPIFSDAGSATLLTNKTKAPEMYFNLGSDGDGAEVIQVKRGGARHQSHGEAGTGSALLSMRGVDVMQYSLRHVEPNVRELLEYADSDIDAPDFYVFHQANRILNRALLKKLGIPAEKAPETLFNFGNTSIATIPVTICHRLREALGRDSSKLVLSGFGAGFSWASALVHTEPPLYTELFELT
jgi:3-oxoacyl-[acyl-carrier-protein] synthase III